MNQYITGAMIKRLREERNMTQVELAEILNVSDRTISKWENAKGYPDITLIEPIAQALGISTIELLSGDNIMNKNRTANMSRTKLYVCPVCGNVICSVGEAVISCCGICLPVLEVEQTDEAHPFRVERIEDEYYVTVDHEMTKEHSISFMAAISEHGIQLIKLYPEGEAAVRFPVAGTRKILFYCNHHGLFEVDFNG